MRNMIFGALLSVTLGTASVGVHGAVLLDENFDTDVGGWIQNTIGTTVSHQAAGGNPNGFALSRAGTAFPTAIGAQNQTAPYAGDYAAAGIDTVILDLNFISGSFSSALLRFRSSGANNGWSVMLTDVFNNEWQSYTVVFDPNWTNAQAQANGWTRSAPELDFADLWRNVFSANIRLSGLSSTPLVAGIDNFSLGSTTSVPEPATLALLGFSLLLLGVRKSPRSVRQRQINLANAA